MPGNLAGEIPRELCATKEVPLKGLYNTKENRRMKLKNTYKAWFGVSNIGF